MYVHTLLGRSLPYTYVSVNIFRSIPDILPVVYAGCPLYAGEIVQVTAGEPGMVPVWGRVSTRNPVVNTAGSQDCTLLTHYQLFYGALAGKLSRPLLHFNFVLVHVHVLRVFFFLFLNLEAVSVPCRLPSPFFHSAPSGCFPLVVMCRSLLNVTVIVRHTHSASHGTQHSTRMNRHVQKSCVIIGGGYAGSRPLTASTKTST